MTSLDSLADAHRAIIGQAPKPAEQRTVPVPRAQVERQVGVPTPAWADRLMPHQVSGVDFGVKARRWILGDEMGLGKTVQAIAWLDRIAAKRVIVVCQAEIAPQFAGEFSEWAPHRECTLLTKIAPAKRRIMLNDAVTRDGVIVVNFELFRRDKESMLTLLQWHADTVIVDEAHNLKNRATSNYKNCEALILADNQCPSCKGFIVGLRDKYSHWKPCPACGWRFDKGPTPILPMQRLLSSKSVKNVCLTTGTPILNTPEDFYPLLHLVNPARFARLNDFTEAYCQINYSIGGRMEFTSRGLQQLRPALEDHYIARTLEDAGVELPEQRVHTIPVRIDKDEYPDQYRVMHEIHDQAKITLESGSHTIMHVQSWIMRKRQACVWPAGIEIRDTDKQSPTYGDVILRISDEVDESAKFDALSETLAREHAAGRRQLVFSQFRSALAALERRLTSEGYRVVRYDGDTPPKLRDAIREEFARARPDARWDVVLVHYRSGGTGLNLQGATVTHILDEEWSPGRRDQAYARTHRLGQQSETDVYVYRVPGSVEVMMHNLIRLKERMLAEFDSVTPREQAEITEQLYEVAISA